MNNKAFIDKITDDDLWDLIDQYAELISIDKNKFYNTAKQAYQYYSGSKEQRKNNRYLQNLENKWYESLDNNNPDYTIYDDKYYVADLWACWKIYSRKYLKNIQKKDSLFTKSIIEDIELNNICVDLGCGLSYSTATLNEIFPNNIIFGTNLKSSTQFIFNKYLAKKHKFNIVESINDINGAIDLIFASEYFEHFQNPIEHLEFILQKDPKYLILANAFGSKSIGHFNFYIHRKNKISNDKMGRYFNDYLRFKGYEIQKTKCWNNRPSYWKKKVEKKPIFN